ncbi:MAG TPA: peptidylprolyl isomerase [Polyangia bacterium]|nr:peptidylprolyl isomerase [Polyangia bacterium]
MKAAPHKVVTIAYTLSDDAGEVLESSEGDEPLSYIHGAGNIVPGLERALEGKAAGESVHVVVPPDEAYGPRDPALVQTIPVRQIQTDDRTRIKVGGRYKAWLPAGAAKVEVTAIDGDQVSVDGNHPLAGQTLRFDVQVLSVRDATPQELAHGHVHGPGGHH